MAYSLLKKIATVFGSHDTTLDLSFRGLRQFPEHLRHMDRIRELSLQGNELKQISTTIAGLKQLSRLDLSQNHLPGLPRCLKSLQSLNQICLHHNCFGAFPPVLLKLAMLKELDLRNNRIKRLPWRIRKLKQVSSLYLNNNEIQRLPAFIGAMQGLEKLHLNNNSLRKLPRGLCRLPRLQELDLRNNRIRTLPGNIGNLQRLRWLFLGNNELRSLPESIGRLTQLWELHIYANRLTELPESIGNLVNLQELHVYGNQITRLPASFSRLTQLQHLRIDDNPIEFPPREVLREGVQSIREYLRTHQKQTLKPVYSSANAASSHMPAHTGNPTLLPNYQCISGPSLPFQLYEQIGQGGMGSVYRGKHLNLHIEVAVKFVDNRLLQRHPGLRERFLKEARIAAAIDHPNVVRVFDLGEDRERVFIVMEYISGGTVFDLVKKTGPLPVAAAVDIIRQCCRALAQFHNRGYVHRDVKPENMLIKDSVVKLADFGIIKDPDERLTEPDLAIGTPNYMPPEQYNNASGATAASDIFSLGLCFHYLLTGQHAFEAAEKTKTMYHICFSPLPEIQRNDVPGALRAVIRKATEKNMQQRYQHASEMHLALRDM